MPCVDDETQGTSSFFYDKVETLGIEDRWRGVVWEQHRRSDRVTEFPGALKRKQIDTQLLLLAMMAAQALIDAMQFMILKILIRALFFT